MALAYRGIGKVEEAIQYIKRIVIWPSTTAKIKELYNELVERSPKEEEKKEVKYLNYNRNLNYLKASKNPTEVTSINSLKHKGLC